MKAPEKKEHNIAPEILEEEIFSIGYNQAIDEYEKYHQIALKAAVMANTTMWHKWIDEAPIRKFFIDLPHGFNSIDAAKAIRTMLKGEV